LTQSVGPIYLKLLEYSRCLSNFPLTFKYLSQKLAKSSPFNFNINLFNQKTSTVNRASINAAQLSISYLVLNQVTNDIRNITCIDLKPLQHYQEDFCLAHKQTAHKSISESKCTKYVTLIQMGNLQITQNQDFWCFWDGNPQI